MALLARTSDTKRDTHPDSGARVAAAALVRNQADLVRRITNLIRHYEPAALGAIANTISKFEGEESSLLETLVAMYGPELPEP